MHAAIYYAGAGCGIELGARKESAERREGVLRSAERAETRADRGCEGPKEEKSAKLIEARSP